MDQSSSARHNSAISPDDERSRVECAGLFCMVRKIDEKLGDPLHGA